MPCSQHMPALWHQENQVNSEIVWSIQFSVNPRINVPPNYLCLYFTPRYDLSPGMTEHSFTAGHIHDIWQPGIILIFRMEKDGEIVDMKQSGWSIIWLIMLLPYLQE